MLGPGQVYKINTPLEVRYVAKNNFSGLTDLMYVITSPSQVDSSPVAMTEIQPGIYRAYFTPDAVGYWWVRVYSISHPEFNFTDDFFVSVNYGYLDITLMANNSTVLIDGGILKSNLLVDNLVLIDGRDISVDGAVLDSHIANTNNPHSVTKTQVGLENVTNDTQLKRAANDFTTFTEKVTPIGNDIILIEDSADSYSKKKVLINNISHEYFQNSDDTVSSTTSTSYQNKTTLTFTPNVAGTYLIQWYCEVTNSNSGKYTDVRIYLDGTTTLAESRFDASFSYPLWHNDAGLAFSTLTVASHTIILQWKADTNTAYIRNARIIVTRLGA